MIRGRRDARWLPSRFNSALFRLFAFLRLRSLRPEPADVALVVDRHQSALENFAIGGWVWLTLAVFVAAWLSRFWSLSWALLAAFPVALLILQVSILVVGGLFVRLGNNLRLNSRVLLGMLSAAALHTMLSPVALGWSRLAGLQFLLILALNAVASLVLRALRDNLARIEAAMGGSSSEL